MLVSGHHPLAQATHLVNKYPETNIERRGQDIVIGDRKFTKADIQDLPFPDKSFDFVNATHVIEHTENPYKAVSELMRVGKSGYIECPSIIAENFLFGSENHRFVLLAFVGHTSFLKSTRPEQRQVPNLFWKAIRACDIMFNLCHTRFYWGNGRRMRFRYSVSNTANVFKKAHIFLTYTLGDAFQEVMNRLAILLRSSDIQRIKSFLVNIEEADGNER